MTELMTWLGVVTVASPAAAAVVLGTILLLGCKPSEPLTHRILQAGVLAGLIAAVGIFIGMQITGVYEVEVDLGEWVHIDGPNSGDSNSGLGISGKRRTGDYDFHVKLLFDRLSVPFCALSFVLCATIGAFAERYIHRERGYHRFFMLYAIFTLGMIVAAVAGTVETLFAGWELVGLSSVLLIGFYNERPAPVRNGFRVWVIYRTSDAALLLAAILTHRLTEHGDFHALLGEGVWPNEVVTSISPLNATIIGGLLLIAAAGKSALLPFCGWLPRAMEGPTPSSAVFYGALSVHLGAFLLLRMSPLFEHSLPLAIAAVILGSATAVYGFLVGRVQTDIKSALSFASLTQVGIIVAEIGLGFRYLALVHLLGHACLRTLQFVRAPSLLLEYKIVENAIGGKLPAVSGGGASAWQLRLYRFALERGYLDALLDRFLAAPFLRLFRHLTSLETQWMRALNRIDGDVPAANPIAVVLLPKIHTEHQTPAETPS